MAHHYLSGILILAAFFLLQTSCRPSNNEFTTPINPEDITESDEGRLLKAVEEKHAPLDENTKAILDKIRLVNAALKKPNRRQQIKYNTEPSSGSGYVLNRDILEKLQQIIASGKLQPLLETENYQESNSLSNFNANAQRYSKSLPYSPNTMMGNQIGASIVPLPYITNMPVVIMPSVNAYSQGLGNDYNHVDGLSQYQTRQGPPTFQFQWPLAQYFPILIKDPLLAILQGGGWSSIFETGQTADVCSRKQKSAEESNETTEKISTEDMETNNDELNHLGSSLREGKAIKKRTLSKSPSMEEDYKNQKKMEKFFLKQNATQKPTKHSVSTGEPPKNTKHNDEDDGALRFGTFTFFGDKKPVAPSPGFFINKLKVRRGGVAIAGPGGVATAGRGGTAIVGPGGLAYTQPGGLAVAGPAARVIALPSEIDLSSLVSKLQALSAKDSSVPRLLKEIPEGKVVATGPVVYYHHSNDES